MIEVRNVTKTFDKFKALDNLTLTVQKGAVYGLIGPNGAGKTTILKTIAGIYKQTDGDVLVMGEKIFENASVKSKTVFISDDLYFFTTYSILDTAKFYAKTAPATCQSCFIHMNMNHVFLYSEISYQSTLDCFVPKSHIILP